MNANTENPNEAYSAGKGGTGSTSGRTTNHAATGTSERSNTDGRRRAGNVSDMLWSGQRGIDDGLVERGRARNARSLLLSGSQARTDVAKRMPDLHDPTTSSSLRSALTAPDHLNSTGCKIKYSEGNGRGVYGTSEITVLRPSTLDETGTNVHPVASKAIPACTLLEISPALLFSSEEYEAHGRHTLLDHYTFKWRDGRLALALGLGARFC
jgi:hypothetical protein